MTSKEALEKLYFQCCMSNDIDDKWFEELKIIEEDLEVLEIIKSGLLFKKITKMDTDHLLNSYATFIQ